MSKARDLADFISTGSILSDGTIESTEISGVTADATEINKLDGLTADTTELNKLDGVTATTAELNKLAGTTATTSDFDKLSNVTASATELNYMTGATSSIQSQLDNISVTSGSLTKSFTNGEAATITLSQSISPAPVVEVTKEVAQTGQSSKGAWDVNATASNYDLHNTAYDTTLTPNTSTSTLTLGSGSFASTDVGKRIQGNGGDVILTSTAGAYDTTGGSDFTDTSTIASGSWTMHGLKSAGDADGLTITGSSDSGNYASVMDVTDNYETKITLGGTSALGLQGFTMHPEGLYLFAVDSTNDTVLRYDFGTAWDLSTLNTTATSGQSLSVVSYDHTCVDIAFNPTGTKLYVAGQNNDTIYQWNLSTAYDLSTASYSANLSVQGALKVNGGFNGIFVTPDGTKIYTVCRTTDRLGRWNFSSSQDIDGAAFDSATDLSGTNTYPFDIAWNPDGSAMYLAGNNSGFYKFNANTAFETTSGFSQDTSFSVTVNVNAVEKFFIKPDETRIYTMYNNEISQWNIGELIQPTSQYHIAVTNSSGQIDSSFWTDINSMTADQSLGDGEAYYAVSTDDRTTWSVAKASDGVRPIVRDNAGTWQYNSDAGVISGWNLSGATYDSTSFSLGSNSSGQDMFIDSSGTRMYVINSVLYSIYQYSLSTAWDVSTASFVRYVTLTGDDTATRGIFFKEDGTKMYIGAAGGDDFIYEYHLSTPWDISTENGIVNQIDVTTPTSEQYIAGLYIKSDGTRIYSTGRGQDKAYQWTLTTAWDLSTATSLQQLDLSGQTSGPNGVHFKSDGTELYVVSFAPTDSVLVYSLSTAWDITSATYSHSFSLASQTTDPTGFFFKTDGTKMYVVGDDNDVVYQYSTGGVGFSTSTTWTDATTNDEFYALQQALGATSVNRMDKTQLDAVADGSHFTLGNTLDLMIALKQDTASASLPTSDGVTINYDAEALNQGAVLGTDYDFDFPANNKVRITSNAAQNLKIRVV